MRGIGQSLILDGLRSIRHAGQFSAFIHGVPLTLPTGERLHLKITRSTLIPRDACFSFSPYTFLTEITGGGMTESGCGESDLKLIALQKSISEAVERILFRSLKGSNFGTTTSNGWAAHFNRDQCERAAYMELLERDAALVHWLTETPFLEIDIKTAPLWIRTWAKDQLSQSEFPHLRILLSSVGHVPTISTLFQNKTGMGVVSHAASLGIEQSLTRALLETGRIAQIAVSERYRHTSGRLLSGESRVLPTGPFEQAVTYAHHHPFPDWIFGKVVSWTEAMAYWRAHARQFQAKPIRYEFHEIVRAPLSVGFCTSPDIQELFFGRTSDALRRGVINRTRLGVLNPSGNFNELPHFVA